MAPNPAVIRAADLQPRPWPNGLGITRDVASGEGWLISIADLGGPAAFSDFPATDRSFVLLGGPGATLVLEERWRLRCRPFVPACFPGDRPTRYEPDAGPARAFNLFCARGQDAARLSVRSLAAGHSLAAGPATLAVHCAEGRLSLGGLPLEAGDTLLHPGDPAIQAMDGAAIVILVEGAARPAGRMS